tara:strand:- start:1189 stop:2121 length:933 start_codon:yes stop_codon:yes gene_type:complete
MINLMHVNDYVIDTRQFRPLLNDKIVEEFEQRVAEFVGAKYACSLHSATFAIFLCLNELKKQTITVPSIIPPVVPNAILTSGQNLNFNDNIDWVGHSYVLHDFEDYKIIDSAQQLSKNQFANQANDEDLMIFSFYPTKPVGSSDGGMVVSNDREKINRLKMMSRYGTSFEDNSWERKIAVPGWKLYMNSIQAYIANQNMNLLEEKTEKYSEICQQYNQAFGLENTSKHLYRINVTNNDQFMHDMKDSGIQCGIHYRAAHMMDCYGLKQLSLPSSEYESSSTVSIPYHEKLTKEEIEYIIKEVRPHVISSH